VSLKSRLKHLEEHRSSSRCDGCGLLPDGPGYIVLIDEERPEESFKGYPEERCARCGRYLWFVIRVVYDPPDDTEGGGTYRWP
jgi:ribosomal protein S14